MEITAGALARIVYCALYLIFFRQRAYYCVFCLLVAFVAGQAGLEYAPALWLPADLLLSLIQQFKSPKRS